jgi:hypothetical protein
MENQEDPLGTWKNTEEPPSTLKNNHRTLRTSHAADLLELLAGHPIVNNQSLVLG